MSQNAGPAPTSVLIPSFKIDLIGWMIWYLERRQEPEVVRAAEITHAHTTIRCNDPLPAKLCNRAPATFRVYAADLSDEHVSTLAAAGETVKFKGKRHLVAPCAGTWNAVLGRPNEAFDLVRAPKVQ